MAGGPEYAGKPRPIVIVRDDRFAELDSVTFVAFTSNLLDAPLTRLNVDPTPANGLQKPCQLMVDKVSSAPKSKLGKRIGELSNDDKPRLDRALLIFLGLSG
jgi:mRNA interferase MazF